MCHPPGALPPHLPSDLRAAPTDLPSGGLPISGGAGGADVILTSEDGARFRGRLVAARGEAGVVIAPDVRGLHRFYEDLAERFAEAGVSTLAFDYFGRTAGIERRGDDFPWRDHVSLTRPAAVQADVASAVGHLRGATDARRIFVVGFCFGGRVAFSAAADHGELAGVIGFYGRLSARPGEEGSAPADRAMRMRAPVLGLFGGADPGIPEEEVRAFAAALAAGHVAHHIELYAGAPHSFFDVSFTEHAAACDDAWRRVLAFIRSGDPAAV